MFDPSILRSIRLRSLTCQQSNPTSYGNTTNNNFDSDVRRDDNYNSSSAGPHKSDMLNKLDPRVDSDNSKAYDSNSNRNANDGFSSSNTTSGYGASTTSGPYDSNMANRADPRVDSDNSRFGSSNTGTLGSSDRSTGLGTTGRSDFDNSSSNYNSSKSTAGPHSSDMMNKVDPRIDSDRSKEYGSSTHGSSKSEIGAPGFGTTGVTRGPHETDTANALDPNVPQSGYGSTSTSTSTGLGSSGAYGSSNSGHHSSNLANKADPRIDSDNDRLRGPDSSRDNYGVSQMSLVNKKTSS